MVLTLASQQYGPRLVKNFIEDRPSQIVIGSFAAGFIYSILIMRNIHSGDVNFVPHLSILVAVLSAVMCIGMMIYFIHHISVAIQVQSIMERVHNDLSGLVDAVFPGNLSEPLGWGWAAFVWGYALVWFLVSDQIKLLAYRFLDPIKAT